MKWNGGICGRWRHLPSGWGKRQCHPSRVRADVIVMAGTRRCRPLVTSFPSHHIIIRAIIRLEPIAIDSVWQRLMDSDEPAIASLSLSLHFPPAVVAAVAAGVAVNSTPPHLNQS